MRTRSSGRWTPVRIVLLLTGFHVLFVVLFGGLITLPTYLSILKNAGNIPDFLWDFLRGTAPGEDVYLYYAGIVSSVIYLPLALSIEYFVAEELKRGKKVREAIKKAVVNYPIFLAVYAGFLFFETLATPLVPLYLFFLYWRARGKVDWKTLLVPLLLFLTLPFADTIRESFYLRRALFLTSLLLMPAMAYLAVPDSLPNLSHPTRRVEEKGNHVVGPDGS